MTDDEKTVYSALRRAALTTQRGGQAYLLAALERKNHCTLPYIFKALKDLGFVICEKWGSGIPGEAYVNEIPPAPTGMDRRRIEHSRRRISRVDEADDLCAYFAHRWQQRFERRYPLSITKERRLMSHLLKTYAPEELRQYVHHFFMYFDDRPYYNILYFYTHLEEIIRSHVALETSLRRGRLD